VYLQVRLGSKVQVKADEIGDWAYMKNGELIGGFSVAVLEK
jgi:uncharacterized protein YegJ (DUF2314 family)